MTARELLSRLRKQGVRLWIEGDRLRYRALGRDLSPSQRAEVAAHKNEIVAFLRSARAAVHQESSSIQLTAREGELPLSFAQQRLWFLNQLMPGSSAYNMPAAFCLTGRVSVAALRGAFNEVVRRHEVLRTAFAAVDGHPVQIPAPSQIVELPVVDLSEIAGIDRDPEARRLATAEARRPFDLARGPLLRTTLVRLDDEKHLLLVTMHHIVSDGWSTTILTRELGSLYEALVDGNQPELPDLPVQYIDFAVWQRTRLQGDVLAEHLDYWRRQLAGIPEMLELQTDRARPPVLGFRGASKPFDPPRRLVDKLRELGRREGTTLFVALLAAFQALLFRYTGQTDVIVGIPVANRTRVEIEDLIGCFVNTLVMRAEVRGDLTFLELLAQVHETRLEAHAHRDLPFEMLVEELEPTRDTSRNPIAQVVLAIDEASPKSLDLPGLTMHPATFERTVSRGSDLEFQLRESPEGVAGFLLYNPDLFEAGTITRMLAHLQRLIESIVADPSTRIGDLSILTEEERHQLLVDWNETRIGYPGESCVHEMFEAQAGRTPDAVAASVRDQHLTYRELARQAGKLAHRLQELGVGPEMRVGICTERSAEMLVGILGTLKAGGAYVPLDPAYPPERLAFMLDDSAVAVVLTQATFAGGLLTRFRTPDSAVRSPLVCLDTEWEHECGRSESDPIPAVSPHNLAYVIYTSGSTGRPKGVMVKHQGVCNLVQAQARLFEIDSDSRVLQFAASSFDASVSEIFVTLLSGASLRLASREDLLPGPDLAGELRNQAITSVTLPPSVLALLPEQSLPGLRTIVSAGEACPARTAARWGAGRRFINAYGPTENTVCATAAILARECSPPPIGRPIANCHVYLLDAHLSPVPVGVPGELYIGGVGLARGYLRRPALTAASFVPHLFSDESGDRLYRTGDLARYLPDGNIEFVGRIDHQLKVRGFRIEPGEIKTSLCYHPAVRDAVILACATGPGELQPEPGMDARLVAYVAAPGEPQPTTGELLAFLRERLPDHMLPSAFVVLEALPLTPNGKVDRKALPGTSAVRPDLEQTFVPPGTRTEERLAAIWADLLHLDHVGIHDSFFDLGGHSLLMIQAHSRIQAEMERQLAVLDLFDHPTIASLARHLDEGGNGPHLIAGDDHRAEQLVIGERRLERQLEQLQLARSLQERFADD